MEYKYTGIVLNKRDIGETDRIYNIYTLEKGKISAIARGVRKAQSKLAGNLENFYSIDLTVMKNKGLGNISSSIVEDNFLNLRQDFESLKKVFNIVEIFTRLINEEEQDEKIFVLFLNYLKAMNRGTSNNKSILNVKKNLITQGFIFKLLELLGYKMEMSKCVKCRCRFLSGKNFFDYSLGGVVCRNCLHSSNNIMPIGDNSIKIIRIFFQNNLSSLFKINIKQKEINELERISQSFLRWIA